MNRRARFLVLRGGAIGDFILTLPAIHALRERWPDAVIELVGYPHIANLALEAGLVDRVESLDRAGMAKFFTPTPTFTEEQGDYIRSFDVVISYLHDPGGFVQDNLRAAGAKQVIYGSPIVEAGHATDHLLKPLEVLAIYAAGAFPRLVLRPESAEAGLRWLADRGIESEALAIHPGSGSPKKNWPVDRFVDLAHALAARGRSPFFIIGEADDAAGRAILDRAPGVPVLSGASLSEVAAVLSHCVRYVGNDSGITHLAAALGIQVVAIFGNSDADRWGPRGPNVWLLRAQGGDLAAVSLDQVLEALEKT